MRDWAGLNVVVVGAARQGIALSRYLVGHGARVVLTDRQEAHELESARKVLADYPIEWVLGGHPLTLLDGIDMLCLSAGVPLNLPLVVAAQKRDIPLSNDSQIFLETVPCQVIGVTGSAGKTTTTTLVGRMVQASSRKDDYPKRAWIGGNIGNPLIEVVDEMSEDDLAVMELSSFQLEIMSRSPQIAAVLNISPNHLDRHGTMRAYIQAKANILHSQKMGDVAVLGREDPGSWSLAEFVQGRLISFGREKPPLVQPWDGEYRISGTYLEDEMICLWETGSTTELFTRRVFNLRGEHNLLNLLAACAIAHAAGLSREAMRDGVEGFTGIPHRLEFVREWGGADWYNDSIATAPERTIAAIRSFHEPLVLLAGGRDKDLSWKDFASVVRERVKQLILFGEASEKIQRAMNTSGTPGGVKITRCQSLQEAVGVAAKVCDPGDVVLLSPGGTSFDEFRDFEDRGENFRKWVNELG